MTRSVNPEPDKSRAFEFTLKHLFDADRVWPDDAKDENGNYQCVCSYCGLSFMGRKQRTVCRACAATAKR